MSNTENEQTWSGTWDRHVASEFIARSPEQALESMSANPYSNLVPVLNGGQGREEMYTFYAKHFLTQIPPDMELVPVSRTVGQGRVVDELVARFTHTLRMDWLLPGVEATGRRVELPFVVIASIEEGKVTREHLYWDQASVLVQLGLLNPSGLPVRGAEVARQVLNPTEPMNALIPRG